MSCNTLTSLTKECTPNIGSIKKLYFLLLENLEDYSQVNYTITGMTVTVPFVEYQVPLNSASYSVDYNVDEIGIEEFTHSVSIRISKRRPTAHQKLKEITEGNPDLVVLCKDGNNRWWLLGYQNGLNFNTGNGGSGTNKSDGTFYNFELTGVERDFELNVDETLVNSII